MKNIVRAFALTLVVTGAFASNQTNHSTVTPKLSSSLSAVPVPYCAPGDPNGCHIYGR